MMEVKKKMKIHDNKGFHIQFENGYTVSIQMGKANYCDNRYAGWLDGKIKTPTESNTAEVYYWDEDGNSPEENPKGYQSPEQVLQILNKVASIRKVR